MIFRTRNGKRREDNGRGPPRRRAIPARSTAIVVLRVWNMTGAQWEVMLQVRTPRLTMEPWKTGILHVYAMNDACNARQFVPQRFRGTAESSTCSPSWISRGLDSVLSGFRPIKSARYERSGVSRLFIASFSYVFYSWRYNTCSTSKYSKHVWQAIWLLVDFPSCLESILPWYGRVQSLTIFLHRNSYEIAAPNSKRN